MTDTTYLYQKLLDRMLVRINKNDSPDTSKIRRLFMPASLAVQAIVLPLHPYLMAGTRRFKILLPPEFKSHTLEFKTRHSRRPSRECMDGTDIITLIVRNVKRSVAVEVQLALQHDRPYVLSRSL